MVLFQHWKLVKLRIVFTYMNSGSQDRLTKSCYPLSVFFSEQTGCLIMGLLLEKTKHTNIYFKKKKGLFKE